MPSAATTTSRFKSRDNAYGNALGFDFTRGPYRSQHSFAYDRFSNNIEDAVAGTSIFNPAPGISLNFTGGSGFASGPNSAGAAGDDASQPPGPLRCAPGPGRAHTFRFGVAVNKIDTLISANLFGLAPQVGSDTGADSRAFRGNWAFFGGASNPLNYPGGQHHSGKWL